MPLPLPKFDGEGEKWDGTTPRTRPNTDVFKRADAEIGGRHSAEILALEALLESVIATIDLLENPGAANSLLGVKGDQSGLEYKVFVEGSGITIVHAAGSITISSSGAGVAMPTTAGENMPLGAVVYFQNDNKAYKAKADADATSLVAGFCDRAASADDAINVVPIGVVTNVAWALTAGTQYYLSPTVAGEFTSTAPTAVGQVVVSVGMASAPTIMAVNVLTKVKL